MVGAVVAGAVVTALDAVRASADAGLPTGVTMMTDASGGGGGDDDDPGGDGIDRAGYSCCGGVEGGDRAQNGPTSGIPVASAGRSDALLLVVVVDLDEYEDAEYVRDRELIVMLSSPSDTVKNEDRSHPTNKQGDCVREI